MLGQYLQSLVRYSPAGTRLPRMPQISNCKAIAAYHLFGTSRRPVTSSRSRQCRFHGSPRSICAAATARRVISTKQNRKSTRRLTRPTSTTSSTCNSRRLAHSQRVSRWARADGESLTVFAGGATRRAALIIAQAARAPSVHGADQAQQHGDLQKKATTNHHTKNNAQSSRLSGDRTR